MLERLDPSYWVQHADSRGLSGTLTERPEVTAAGIVCGVRLDGKGWSAKKLAAEAAGIPVRTWRDWRAGKGQSARNLRKLETAHNRLITIPRFRQRVN
ncbi:hypothetical protein ACFCV3_42670, partial [Kribbella sp. NPDC056345]|uniref:hypothetical protein n=1 Tax=Kribbella sp. NPDC056345 TaxID=3345789 RepID=UPI0035DB5926